jgi:predicted heme/steroid binding protein
MGKDMKEFAFEELSSFNGKEGKPVYLAFEGKVYDVSKSPLWSKGIYMNRHPSGKDLSGKISAAPHGIEVFERFSQVGILNHAGNDPCGSNLWWDGIHKMASGGEVDERCQSHSDL